MEASLIEGPAIPTSLNRGFQPSEYRRYVPFTIASDLLERQIIPMKLTWSTPIISAPTIFAKTTETRKASQYNITNVSSEYLYITPIE